MRSSGYSLGQIGKFFLAAAFAFLFLCQGIHAPFEKDEESRPAGLIRDVVQHGDWLVPRDDYGEASRKPPLYYWLSAIAAKVSGGSVDEARARVISVIAAAAIAAEVELFGAQYLGATAGSLAILFLLGIYGFSARAGYARTDMLFSALLFSAWYALYAQIEAIPTRARTLLIGVLLGLAVLTKGPLALVLCALGVAIYLALERRNPIALLRSAWPWQVLALSLAIAALWYVPAFLHDRSLLSVQFGEENLGHLLPSRWGGTGEAARPVYYIVARMFGTALPLGLYFPALALALTDSSIWGDARRPVIYQLSIVLAIVAMFSIASSKRDVYILPALPSLAILFAALFTVAPRLSITARTLWIAAGAIIAAAAVILVVGAVLIDFGAAIPARLTSGMQSSDAAYTALVVGGITNWRWRTMVFIAASAIAAALIARGLTGRRVLSSAFGVALMSVAGVQLWIGALRPELTSGRTLKPFASEMKAIVDSRPVYLLGGIDYELSFYMNRGIPVWKPSETQSWSDDPTYVVASSDDLHRATLEQRANLKPLIHWQSPLSRRQMWLMEAATNRH